MTRRVIMDRLNNQEANDKAVVVKKDGFAMIRKQVRDQIATNEELLKKQDTPAGITEIRRITEKTVYEFKDHLSNEDQKDKVGVVKRILDDVCGYGPIQDYLVREDITEVMVYNPNKIRYEVNGVLQEADENVRFQDEKHLMDVIEKILRPLNIPISPSNPEANARLSDGSRVHILIKPVAIDGPYMTIRKFKAALGIEDLLHKYKMLTPEIVAYYRMMMQLSKSFMVSGGTGTGKTSHLNAISSFIPDHYDIITIEDTAELQLQQQHVRRVETQQKTSDSTLVYEMIDGVKSSLRMNPTIIIVGETRDGKTAVSVMKAMNTGHEGSGSSIHSNSIRDMFNRISTMILEDYANMNEQAIIRTIGSAIQWVVQLKKNYITGKRYVSEIGEIDGLDEKGNIKVKSIFKYNPKTGITEPTGEISNYVEEARQLGLEIPAIFQESGAEE